MSGSYGANFPPQHEYDLPRQFVFRFVLIAFLLWVQAEIQRSPYVTEANMEREQPVQFSHKHHVADDGIDCRYCHTSVEISAFAGIPPTKTCMNCHSQIFRDNPYLEPVRESFHSGKPIEWTRVHQLADFVYFDHSIHVSKGVGCATCHGRVDQMSLVRQVVSLQMEWCLPHNFDVTPVVSWEPYDFANRPDREYPAALPELGVCSPRLRTDPQERGCV